MIAARSLLVRSFASLVVLASLAGAAAAAVDRLLPAADNVALGVRVDGETIPPNVNVRQYLQERASAIESRQVRVSITDALPPRNLSLGELGVRVDVDSWVRRTLAIGRTGPLEQRLDQSLRARQGSVDIPSTWTLDPQPCFDLLLPPKEDVDAPGAPARFDFASNTVQPHTNGRYLDAYATLDAVERLLRLGGNELRASFIEVPPVASEQLLRNLDISQTVGHFETRFGYLGAQADRAHNIATAASRLDGVVILPSQVLSFNQLVGHRTLENGFKKGWEIFRGEMVQGVGGGTCQVASTLHASAYLAGFDVLERSPHSRPSGYIPLGLDATVVDGLVDLKLRNPFSFPVVLRAVTSPGSLRIELVGEQRPAQVTFRGDVVDVQRYKRRLTEASWLAEGRVLRKQRGIRGYRVRKTRSVILRDGTRRDEITTDVYPPTMEILLVPPGTDETSLPPLPFPATGSDEATSRDAPDTAAETSRECGSACPPAPVIADAPEAARSAPPQVTRETVIQR